MTQKNTSQLLTDLDKSKCDKKNGGEKRWKELTECEAQVQVNTVLSKFTYQLENELSESI